MVMDMVRFITASFSVFSLLLRAYISINNGSPSVKPSFIAPKVRLDRCCNVFLMLVDEEPVGVCLVSLTALVALGVVAATATATAAVAVVMFASKSFLWDA